MYVCVYVCVVQPVPVYKAEDVCVSLLARSQSSDKDNVFVLFWL